MEIYHYHPSTGDFMGRGVADESPLEPGAYLIPAHATTTVPPAFNPVTQSCRFSNGVWVVASLPIEDPEPIPTPTLSDVVAARLTALATYRYQIETGGITVNGNDIATNRETQAMLTGARVTVQTNPEILIDWKCDNGWTQIDKANVEALSAIVAAHVQACFSRERAHSEAISALTTIAEVNAYDFTTGWPE